MDQLSRYGPAFARALKGFKPVHILHFRSLVILCWIWLVYHGERTAFDNAISRCNWSKWEPWAVDASPHHMVLLADPQLVDPHTYPGRPWPLSSLTVSYTDRYLKRCYTRIQSALDPDSIYFLGDLFDGGREWPTGAQGFKDTDKRWARYNHNYWKREYRRFAGIFLRAKEASEQQSRHRNVILSLPGNHDIGFGTGVQPVVRNRFQTYFGESNRVDILGNHTFVGLDTVSLSAMSGQGEAAVIWKPTFDFLDHVQGAIRHKTDVAFGFDHTSSKFEQKMTEHARDVSNSNADTAGPPRPKRKHSDIQQLPIVAMSHVPLYRDPGTPCGPLRERSPPSAPGLETDEPNSIRVAGGYQYQNVLTKEATKLIADKLERIRYAFSGDDHDYCELTHRTYASAGTGIKEVTVKSMSWAMGIRKPGFLLVSLWNPVDEMGQSTPDSPQRSGQPTLSSQLCLLPDQLAIFIRYAWCLVFTALALAIHALVAARRDKLGRRDDAILPLNANVASATREVDPPTMNSNLEVTHGYSQAQARSNSISSSLSGLGLPSNKTASGRPHLWQMGHKAHKLTDHGDFYLDDDEDKGIGRRNKKRGLRRACLDRLTWDMGVVAGVVGAYYLWLLHRG